MTPKMDEALKLDGVWKADSLSSRGKQSVRVCENTDTFHQTRTGILSLAVSLVSPS